MYAGTRPAHTDPDVSADTVDRRTTDAHANDNADRAADRDRDADTDANIYASAANPDAASFANRDVDAHAKPGANHGDRARPARATGQARPAAFIAAWRGSAAVGTSDGDTHASSRAGETIDQTGDARIGKSGFFRRLTFDTKAYPGYVEPSSRLVRQLTWH